MPIIGPRELAPLDILSLHTSYSRHALLKACYCTTSQGRCSELPAADEAGLS